jgi:hypothetical protein
MMKSRGLARVCASAENNLGVALQKLAETGVEPVANLKRAIGAYAGAIARLSKTAPHERSPYALYRSNLADSYQLLAAYEEHDANLQQARQGIEDSLAVIRTTNDPDSFAEIMYKFGEIEMAEAADRHEDARERAGLADWACSLVVFDRLRQNRAALVAHALNAVMCDRGTMIGSLHPAEVRVWACLVRCRWRALRQSRRTLCHPPGASPSPP